MCTYACTIFTYLRNCLTYMKQVATHTMDYVDDTTTNILSPDILPVKELKGMLRHIGSQLHSIMYLPISLDNALHFYRYLKTHVLVAEEQFLLLIDVPIQDRAQQPQIYKISNLPVSHGDMSGRYKINDKYIGITHDETQAVVITEQQYSTCLHANGQFCKVDTLFQALTNPPICTVTLYAKNNKEIEAQCLLSAFHMPPAFLPIVIMSNLWIFIFTPTTQGSAITMIFPDKATSSLPLQQPFHILKLPSSCSGMSRHFYLPPHYEDNVITILASLERANLNSFSISVSDFHIWQHISSSWS